MKFKSKIDFFFYVLTIVITAGTAVFFYGYFKGNSLLLYAGILFGAFDLIFLIPTVFNTYYLIKDDYLIVKSCAFVSRKIPIKDIISVEATKDPSSAPAISMNRLKIEYKQDEYQIVLIISPKEKQKFIDELKKKMKE
ncbi:MAG: PH domain-containing protein [Eubacteriales bacterium]